MDHQTIFQYVWAMVGLYGAVAADKALAIIQQRSGETVTLAELETSLAGQDEISLEDGYVAHDDVYAFDSLEHLLAEQGDKPFYWPDNEEFFRYASDTYFAKNPAYEPLKSCLMTDFTLKEPDADAITEDLLGFFSIGCDALSDIMPALARHGADVRDLQKVKKLLRLAADMANHTRRWVHRGYTPVEMNALTGKPELLKLVPGLIRLQAYTDAAIEQQTKWNALRLEKQSLLDRIAELERQIASENTSDPEDEELSAELAADKDDDSTEDASISETDFAAVDFVENDSEVEKSADEDLEDDSEDDEDEDFDYGDFDEDFDEDEEDEGTYRVLKLLEWYVLAFVNLYGAVPKAMVLEIFAAQQSLTAASEMLDQLDLEDENIIDNDKYFYSQELQAKKGDLQRLLAAQADKPYYIPAADELFRYTDIFYFERTPELQRLQEYLVHNHRIDVDEAEALCEDVALTCAMDDFSMEHIWEYFTAYGLRFRDKKQLQDLMTRVIPVVNTTRLQVNRGHTPDEIRRLAPALKPIPERAPGQGSGAMGPSAHKFGRNDPCPCGSGKKYKLCCGR